jgi:hypothetical protein
MRLGNVEKRACGTRRCGWEMLRSEHVEQEAEIGGEIKEVKVETRESREESLVLRSGQDMIKIAGMFARRYIYCEGEGLANW